MEPSTAAEDRLILETLRRRRAELRESMSELELALAAPTVADERQWADRVHRALTDLAADFRVHVEITEGAEGLYNEVLQTAPRLSEAVTHLTREHAIVKEQLTDLLSLAAAAAGPDIDTLRERGTALLGVLVRHRQRGSDLVYEAYEVDIGGDT